MLKYGISCLTLTGIILTVSGQTTVPATLDSWLYTCESQFAQCPLGYAINVENMYLVTLAECPTQSPVIDQCHTPMLDLLVDMQRASCNGKRTCQIYQTQGYRGPCGTTTFGLVLFKCDFVGIPLHPETTPEPTTTTTTPAPIVNTYCDAVNLTCPGGHMVSVQGIDYGAKVGRCDLTSAGCCSYDSSDCFQPVSDVLLNVQRRICENRTYCLSIDLSGYQLFCDGQRYISSYGFVKYHCQEVTNTEIITTSVTPSPTPPTTTQSFDEATTSKGSRPTTSLTTKRSALTTTSTTKRSSPSTTSTTKRSAPSTTSTTKRSSPSTTATTKRSSPSTTSTTKRSPPSTPFTTKRLEPPVTKTTKSLTTVTKTSTPPVVTTTSKPNRSIEMEVFEKAQLVLNLAKGGPLFGVLSSIVVQLHQ